MVKRVSTMAYALQGKPNFELNSNVEGHLVSNKLWKRISVLPGVIIRVRHGVGFLCLVLRFFLTCLDFLKVEIILPIVFFWVLLLRKIHVLETQFKKNLHTTKQPPTPDWFFDFEVIIFQRKSMDPSAESSLSHAEVFFLTHGLVKHYPVEIHVLVDKTLFSGSSLSELFPL